MKLNLIISLIVYTFSVLTFAGPISAGGGGPIFSQNKETGQLVSNALEKGTNTQILFKSITCETLYANSRNTNFQISITQSKDGQLAFISMRIQDKNYNYTSKLNIDTINSCEKHPTGCGGILFYTNVTIEFDGNKKIGIQFPEWQPEGHGYFSLPNEFIEISCTLNSVDFSEKD